MNSARLRYRALPGALCVLVGVLLGTLGVSLPDFLPGSPPAWRTLLLALGGVAAVAGALDVLLSPGRAVPRDVAAALHGSRVADAEARFEAADAGVDADTAVDADASRVYFPDGTLALGHEDAIDGRAADAPVTVDAVGARLLASLPKRDADAPDGGGEGGRDVLVARLADAATGRFELADDAAPLAVDADAVRVAVSGCALGDPSDVDHPVASLFGVGLARAADAPVAVDAEDADESEGDAATLTVRQV